ncbi:MFS transporter [Camelimonas sp. ID_303_24]
MTDMASDHPQAPVHNPAQPAGSPSAPGRAILFLAMASFVSAATARVADPLLPEIGREFGATPGQAGLIVAAFSISYGLLQAVYGPVGDAFGKYRLVAIATFMSSLGVIASAFAGSLQVLALTRLLSGATAAAIIPLSMAWIGDVVPYEQRQSVLAKFMSGQILGLVFGQAFGGMLSEIMGWRQVFVVLALLYVLASAGLTADMFRKDHPPPVRSGSGGVGRGVLQMLGLLTRPWPRTVIVMVFLEGAIVFGCWAYVGSELQRRFAIGPGTAGAILAVFGFGGLAYALNARTMVKRFGERGLVIWGGVGLAIAFTLIAITPVLWSAIIASAICGLSFYMLHNTLQTNATQMAPEARGSAVSLFASALFIGQTAGVAVIGPMFDRWGGQPGLIIAAILTPLLVVWFAGRLRYRPE